MKTFGIKNYLPHLTSSFLPHPTSPYKGEEAKGEGTKKGFGLLEVLISAVIIIMILAALVFIGRAALSNNEYLAERAQAVYLAQEGLELTRQIRDTNWIDGDNTTKWNTLVYSGTPPFTVPTSTTPVTQYSLKYDGNIKRMHLETWINTSGIIAVGSSPIPYNRQITVQTIASNTLLPNIAGATDLTPYAMKVTSSVYWITSGKSNSVTASEILTNWRPDF